MGWRRSSTCLSGLRDPSQRCCRNDRRKLRALHEAARDLGHSVQTEEREVQQRDPDDVEYSQKMPART